MVHNKDIFYSINRLLLALTWARFKIVSFMMWKWIGTSGLEEIWKRNVEIVCSFYFFKEKNRNALQPVPEETLFIIKAINPLQSHFTMTKTNSEECTYTFVQKVWTLSKHGTAQKHCRNRLRLCFRSQWTVEKVEESMIYKMNCELYMSDACRNKNYLVFCFGNEEQRGQRMRKDKNLICPCHPHEAGQLYLF